MKLKNRIIILLALILAIGSVSGAYVYKRGFNLDKYINNITGKDNNITGKDNEQKLKNIKEIKTHNKDKNNDYSDSELNELAEKYVRIQLNNNAMVSVGKENSTPAPTWSGNKYMVPIYDTENHFYEIIVNVKDKTLSFDNKMYDSMTFKQVQDGIVGNSSSETNVDLSELDDDFTQQIAAMASGISAEEGVRYHAGEQSAPAKPSDYPEGTLSFPVDFSGPGSGGGGVSADGSSIVDSNPVYHVILTYRKSSESFYISNLDELPDFFKTID